ncbi:MAG: NAD-dependent epimerase/dehydratase family protein, partial [Gemmatimonadota bacterium]|nr:NAD-dependent epimerase/dehydratase family protein [Gemmatimonadota bacterium]
MSEESRKVLVTGGAGFIASHVAEAYLARGHRVFIVDDLSSGRMENVPEEAEFVEMDVADPALGDLIRQERFDLINHHAAQIDVRVSVADPAKDARINIMGLINLAEAAREAGTRRVVFVSSGGVVYGEPEQVPTPEDAPKLPLSPYGVSKLTGEYYLHYYRMIQGLEYVAL